MSNYYNASEYAKWEAAGLKDYGDFCECVEYVNQSEYGCDQLEGEWYYCDDETLTIYYGTFGNDNSPGASCYTDADVYSEEERADYEAAKAEWEAQPEYTEEQEQRWKEEEEEEEGEDA
jgi:hypothetical protein